MELSVIRQKEILKLIIKVLKKPNYNSGICGAIPKLDLQITPTNEYYLINNLINANKPETYNQYKEFTQNHVWNDPYFDPDLRGYWWLPISNDNPLTRQVRIDFIKALINNINTPFVFYTMDEIEASDPNEEFNY